MVILLPSASFQRMAQKLLHEAQSCCMKEMTSKTKTSLILLAMSFMLEDFRCELDHNSAVVRAASHFRAKKSFWDEPAISISHIYLFANVN